MEKKAKVVMSGDVWQKIKWLTENYKNEIGAMGTVKKMKNTDGDGYFYIEKLLFPKQEVGGAHVHIDNNMWADLIKDHYDDLSKIAFYWHKHPGSANHSSVDEEDTFETFMSKEGGRKFFIFLQTAIKSDGKIDTETRIDLRDPRVTIQKENIDLTYRTPAESDEQKKINKLQEELDKLQEKVDSKVEKECTSIIEKCVVRPNHQTQTNCGHFKGYKSVHEEADNDFRDYYTNKEDTEALLALFNMDKNYIDNDIVAGIQTGENDRASFTIGNGHIKCLCAENFKKQLLESCTKGALKEVVGVFKPSARSNGLTEYHIQPTKGNFNKLKAIMTEEFLRINEKVLGDVAEVCGCTVEELAMASKQGQGELDSIEDPDPNYNDYTDEEDWAKDFNGKSDISRDVKTLLEYCPKEVDNSSNAQFVVEQKTMVAVNNEPDLNAQIMADLSADFDLKYKDYSGTSKTDEAIVYNNKGKGIGMIYINTDYSIARYVGEGLAPYVSTLLTGYTKDKLIDGNQHWIAGYTTADEEVKSSPTVKKEKETLINSGKNKSKEALADDSATKRATD